MSKSSLGLLLILFASAFAFSEPADWVATWGAAPVPPGPAIGPLPGTPRFSNQTIRQVVRVSAGGPRVRIRFTNEYGTKPLRIGAARIGVQGQSAAPVPVLFSGKTDALIPADAPLLSDPIELRVDPLASLVISIYIPDDSELCTCHPVAMQAADVSGPGDFTKTGFTASSTVQVRAFLSEIDVESKRPAKSIVAFGDSITDGVGSTPGANRRWPDKLAERLNTRAARPGWGIVNMGISGNRVLADGAGQSALARFDRDVLSVPGVAYVVLFEGVNDIGISYGHFEGPMADFFRTLVPTNKATAAEIVAGYTQLLARAHAKGIKVIGATIAPYEGSPYYSAEGETERQSINQWIRTSHEFDGVLDFDAILRDPTHPTQIATPLQAGDHLHGSDLGYEALANSIDLSIFR